MKPKKPRLKKERAKKEKPSSNPVSRVKFIETNIGHYLYVYAPLEYLLLNQYMNGDKNRGRKKRISAEQIESMAINSDNPIFRTVEFRIALIHYRRYGLRQEAKAKWTVEEAVHYAKYSGLVYKLKECMGL